MVGVLGGYVGYRMHQAHHPDDQEGVPEPGAPTEQGPTDKAP